MMRNKWVWVFAALLWAATGGMIGAQPNATPNQSLAWSHPTADAEAVTRFETNYDEGGYVSVGRVRHPSLVDTFYAPLPSLAAGSHTVVVRACDDSGCSASSAPFAFSVVAGVPTVVTPGSIMIIQTPAL